MARSMKSFCFRPGMCGPGARGGLVTGGGVQASSIIHQVPESGCGSEDMGLIIDPFVSKITGVERKERVFGSSNQSDGTNRKYRTLDLHVPPHSQTPLTVPQNAYARSSLQTSHTVNYGILTIDYCLRCAFS